MNKCDTERLFDYRSGQLHESEAADLVRHLEQCPGCRQELAEISQLKDLLSADPMQAEQFTQRVMTEIVAQTRRAEKLNGARPTIQPVRPGRSESLRQWLFPALQLAFSLSVFALRQDSQSVLDVGSVLIGEVSGETAAQEFSPSVSDLSAELGIKVGE